MPGSTAGFAAAALPWPGLADDMPERLAAPYPSTAIAAIPAVSTATASVSPVLLFIIRLSLAPASSWLPASSYYAVS